jgi:hypothetical protein
MPQNRPPPRKCGGGDANHQKLISALFSFSITPLSLGAQNKQTSVALLSIDSKYWTLVEAMNEAIWTKQLYKDFCFAKLKPMDIYSDNPSMIRVSYNLMYHSKKKHFEIHLNYVRDIV